MFPLPHLRSGFRRRGQSNPTSPLPDQTPSLWEQSAFHDHPYASQDVSPRPDDGPESSNSFYQPSTLPPITRVTSGDSDQQQDPQPQPHFSPREEESSQDGRAQPVRTTRHDDEVGFVGGVALQNRLRGFQDAPRRDNNTSYTNPERQQPAPSRGRVPPPPINTGIPYQRPPPLPTLQRAGSSFVTPTDLQQQLSTEPKGRRPAGTRLVTEPPTLAPHLQQHLEVAKERSRLSSLKDKFLMKRKATNATNEPVPVSPRFQPDTWEPPFDPRIRGTKIHDFSHRKPVTRPVPQQQVPSGQLVTKENRLDAPQPPPYVADVAGGQQNWSHGHGDVQSADLGRGNQASNGSPMSADAAEEQVVQPQQRKPRPLSLDKALPQEPPGPVELTDGGNAATEASQFSATPKASQRRSSAAPLSSASSRTVRSRNVSVSDPTRRDSTMSAMPKHMKSTSSRFSFDMVGAAKQEKLLEEKHRQRQMEKGVDETAFGKDRDSRFDDFDHDDYDYDAMIDDDGLEERIPGVNADLEEDDYPEEEIPGMDAGIEQAGIEEEYFLEEDVQDEEADPDNDQENFSGFVFQRSNPASALASPVPPELLPTPRDPAGKVIGFAMTKDTTPDLGPEPSPLSQSNFAAETLRDSSEGLGIQGLNAEHQPAYDGHRYEEEQLTQPTNGSAPVQTSGDDLYYDDSFIDDGLRDELDFEPEGPAFDESLLDLNDTDKYGRPIPGAFAHAKERWAAQQQAANRQSDETSRMSGQSAISQSTAHTSLDAGLPPVLPPIDTKDIGPDYTQLPERRSSLVPTQNSVLAYQAALAEAAHKAAASGKFRRGSSPPPLAHLTITSPTDSTESHSHPDNAVLDPDDDDSAPRGLDDDYDFDDDVIAEANAEALANDSEGWYGQEFGFYSAPLPVPSHGHGHHSSSSKPDTSPKPLSAENLFQYANGGYFGPAGGVVRSVSGRMVSREPNLTPITERSEYSNRNSIMSFSNLPGIPNSASQLQSPGLAELAMLDDDANMSMSALLRLRSKTFGSSRASLLSSPEGSPRSELSAVNHNTWQRDGSTSPWGAGGHAHMRKSSNFSIQSTTSDGGSGAGSPTLTMSAPPVPTNGLGPSPVFTQGQGQFYASQGHYPSTSPVLPGPIFPPVMEEDYNQAQYQDYTLHPQPQCHSHPLDSQADQSHPPHSHPYPHPLHSQTDHPHPPHSQSNLLPSSSDLLHTSPTSLEETSPSSPQYIPGQGQQKQRPQTTGGHRHKGSADSISYIKEEESTGETRWVMERRRTDERGWDEVVGREEVVGNI
ncbi:hypothetical protein GE09DRAFT_1150114 [Coniochaeta sp. 2T2.1]|nr:hypothetical protein GE09DRAFT_1150114 [Coniochaeta sp. 2T2.1]